MAALDLHDLLTNQLNFAYSEREHSSCASYIRSKRPYYYRWDSLSGGSPIALVTFEENRVGSLKFFKYDRRSFVNLFI